MQFYCQSLLGICNVSSNGGGLNVNGSLFRYSIVASADVKCQTFNEQLYFKIVYNVLAT